MNEKKQKLLKKLEAYFKADESIEEASFFSGEELGMPMDMVRAIICDYGPGLMDILAEFYFLPLKEDDEIWYFTSVLTIKMQLPAEGIPSLTGAISRLNFYLPIGSFCISNDGSLLVYKSVVPVIASDTEKHQYTQIEQNADTAIMVPESYTDLLVRVSDGRLLLKDFLKMLPD